MKGNDGKAARQRKCRRLGIIGAAFGFVVLVVCATTNLVFGNGHPNNKFSEKNRKAMIEAIRDRPVTRKLRRAAQNVFFRGNKNNGQDDIWTSIHRRHDAIMGDHKNDEKDVHTMKELLHDNDPETKEMLEKILSGKMHLVDINVDEGEFRRASSTSSAPSYAGFYGVFCSLDWKLQKDNPSQVPMFKDLLEQSKGCDPYERERNRFDLRHLMALLRAHDWQQQGLQDDAGVATPMKVLNLTAVAFHESRCGSTLVANTFAAMSPQKHRVYSESSPPVKMARLCEVHRCSKEQLQQLWRDVVYMMSRSNDPNEERVFFKFQSAMTTLAISSFHEAFPEVPWFFIYRNPVQVLMSHAKNGALEAGGGMHAGHAVCLRSRSNPSEYMRSMLSETFNVEDSMSLTLAEYCAAHLATLTEYAYEEIHKQASGDGGKSATAVPINYENLMSTLTDTVLPFIWGRPLTADEQSSIDHVSSFYSKGGHHRGRGEKKFDNDNAQKEEEATKEYREAATFFLESSYQNLNAYSEKVLGEMKEKVDGFAAL
mmetsp:Transcript_15551/g.43643  ORF Transcript_15551/g.43643 Transcript_15551/m.43643 type:complete len:541 (-) Transcript_15551:157-1779(-)|eukprot:CAMPEP_0119551656 /NCGR_PEP_ID=MMETSP1352-20130426/4847_1 /TAXON_ID=265584 /ORGANISM="Stauroneis constricta, Strain CCMP1120" /LENGTH=540 /DNA_ID=CAMNT_0007597749 /DNA_START=75 /DNA_END=1697 /DNA_ORIENTATION=-